MRIDYNRYTHIKTNQGGNKLKRLTAFLLAGVTVLSLTGCVPRYADSAAVERRNTRPTTVVTQQPTDVMTGENAESTPVPTEEPIIEKPENVVFAENNTARIQMPSDTLTVTFEGKDIKPCNDSVGTLQQAYGDLFTDNSHLNFSRWVLEYAIGENQELVIHGPGGIYKSNVAVIVTFAIIIAVIAFFIGSYNHLQSMDENVDSSWAQVENQLQRRYDLIPNLAAVVKSYSEYEAQTLTDIVAMRTSGTVEGEKKADEAYTTYVNALTENYPELKADTEYQSLMTELAGTENRIAVARRDYNNAVQTLNGAIRRFPGSLIASMSGVEKREYFEVSTAAQENVDVSKLLSNDN